MNISNGNRSEYININFENYIEGLIIIDDKYTILSCNSEAYKLLEYDNKETLIGENISKFSKIDAKILEIIDKFKIEKQEISRKRWEFIKRDGNILNNELVLIRNKKDTIILIKKLNSDLEISDVFTQDKLKEYAHKDLLTSLYNRTFFMKEIKDQINKAKSLNKNIAILYFDIDNFKTINDTMGHEIGDIVLKMFADELKKLSTVNDIVARLGGDEFAWLITDVKEESEIIHFTNLIKDKFKNPVNIYGNEFYITSSIGISLFPEDTTEAEELMLNADIAMYQAKKEKEKKVIRFIRSMKEDLDEQFKLSTHLRKAIEKDELSVYYQPIVNINTGELISAEALLRWKHSMYGNIPPSKFIPIAEANGLIKEIGDWVLIQVCKQNKKWQEEGYKKIPIAVNISVKQLEEENFADKVLGILKNEQLDPEYIELEITESISMSNLDRVIETLQRFRENNIKISMDDFGTGYSSLGKLKKLAINKLKIDRSFINDLNGQETELVTAIIAMANSLGLNIIAEGIETNEQLNFLQNKNCLFGQGYLFSRPLEKVSFETFMKNG
ncbi:diguanylate cyclase (GGDEF)-like protein [Natranaerovirga pectinivora]|uniref:Diguanylate cyclase (GGDEF)-like protein n=1 Tax=Natranaerovirga pectinivora TaxID=682400 RepID=A0A4V2V0I5_9FIRM|nr:GGDEF domain-containing protein [Natranaerovirga pectinivora]TCT16297.1 diguanylate cyclase (GGDEF)-like protein [Natranaerovirga pectinivora]